MNFKNIIIEFSRHISEQNILNRLHSDKYCAYQFQLTDISYKYTFGNCSVDYKLSTTSLVIIYSFFGNTRLKPKVAIIWPKTNQKVTGTQRPNIIDTISCIRCILFVNIKRNYTGKVRYSRNHLKSRYISTETNIYQNDSFCSFKCFVNTSIELSEYHMTSM